MFILLSLSFCLLLQLLSLPSPYICLCFCLNIKLFCFFFFFFKTHSNTFLQLFGCFISFLESFLRDVMLFVICLCLYLYLCHTKVYIFPSLTGSISFPFRIMNIFHLNILYCYKLLVHNRDEEYGCNCKP